MKLTLCPRCELNYIIGDSDKFCKICMQDLQSTGNQEEVELCSVCNENPALPGKDVCAICLREMNGTVSDTSDDADRDDSVNANDLAGMDSVAEMDEIIPDMEDDISEPEFAQIASEEKEFGDIENPVSLEEEREREDGGDDDENEDDQ